jgi:hypothetical protein
MLSRIVRLDERCGEAHLELTKRIANGCSPGGDGFSSRSRSDRLEHAPHAAMPYNQAAFPRVHAGLGVLWRCSYTLWYCVRETARRFRYLLLERCTLIVGSGLSDIRPSMNKPFVVPFAALAPSQPRRSAGVGAQREVTLLDYGAGNVRSVRNALAKLDCEVKEVCFPA